MNRDCKNPYLTWKVFAALAGLAVLPYLRSVWLPPISDDYLQVWLSRQYGPVAGWPALMHDTLYRSRATSLLMTHWTDLFAGFTPLVFNLTNLAVHVLNSWLVLLLGVWPVVGWRNAAFAAGFFAVYEGHQEAVIWYAALPESLVFLFGVSSFVCWVLWAESEFKRRRWLLASAAAFVLAVFSKESGVVALPLFAIALLFHRPVSRKPLYALAALSVISGVYFAGIYAARTNHLFFHDGTFSLQAPFIRTIAISTARLFWPWGLLAVISLLAARSTQRFRLLGAAMLWIPATLLPYSFLTYMNRVPSRHTYFASAGLALVVAAGFLAFYERLGRRRLIAVAVAAIAIAHNAGYVWTRKHAQYVERAASTEAVVRAVKAASGPVYVHCFPYGFEAAQYAALVGAGKSFDSVRLWSGQGEPPDGILCLDPSAPGPHPARAAR